MTNTIFLDKAKVIERMYDGPTGQHYLVVTPDGDWKIVWRENNASWDPWADKDYVAGMPAIDPEGSGRLGEDAQEFLKSVGVDLQTLEEESGEYVDPVEYAETHCADDWQIWTNERDDWYAEEFLNALNGGHNDLDITETWGAYGDPSTGEYVIVTCPFLFEYQ